MIPRSWLFTPTRRRLLAAGHLVAGCGLYLDWWVLLFSREHELLMAPALVLLLFAAMWNLAEVRHLLHVRGLVPPLLITWSGPPDEEMPAEMQYPIVEGHLLYDIAVGAIRHAKHGPTVVLIERDEQSGTFEIKKWGFPNAN